MRTRQIYMRKVTGHLKSPSKVSTRQNLSQCLRSSVISAGMSTRKVHTPRLSRPSTSCLAALACTSCLRTASSRQQRRIRTLLLRMYKVSARDHRLWVSYSTVISAEHQLERCKQFGPSRHRLLFPKHPCRLLLDLRFSHLVFGFLLPLVSCRHTCSSCG
ncbi:hypothetical protein OBBRIDRAFT_892188, partial [Obba rivulosa]